MKIFSIFIAILVFHSHLTKAFAEEAGSGESAAEEIVSSPEPSPDPAPASAEPLAENNGAGGEDKVISPQDPYSQDGYGMQKAGFVQDTSDLYERFKDMFRPGSERPPVQSCETTCANLLRIQRESGSLNAPQLGQARQCNCRLEGSA